MSAPCPRPRAGSLPRASCDPKGGDRATFMRRRNGPRGRRASRHCPRGRHRCGGADDRGDVEPIVRAVPQPLPLLFRDKIGSLDHAVQRVGGTTGETKGQRRARLRQLGPQPNSGPPANAAKNDRCWPLPDPMGQIAGETLATSPTRCREASCTNPHRHTRFWRATGTRTLQVVF